MEQHWLYILANNQSVATTLGLLVLIASYCIWKKQHKEELYDKYFADYIEAIYKFIAIKKEETDLRKGKNRRCNEIDDEDDEKLAEIDRLLSELNRQEIQNEGLIKSRKFLLRQLDDDDRCKRVSELKAEFGKKYKKFSKKPVCGKGKLKPDAYQQAVDCINKEIDEILEELEKI